MPPLTDIGDAYGIKPGGSVLVRPDGYIGAILGTHEAHALGAYLDRMKVG